MVYGNPAKLRGWACACGEKLPIGVEPPAGQKIACPRCSQQYAFEAGKLLSAG
jgi:hypothetical protein